MKAWALVIKLLNKLREDGKDFVVSAEFLRNPKDDLPIAAPPVDTCIEASDQGRRAAAYAEILEGHNPFDAGTPEADAWHQAFTAARTPVAPVVKGRRKKKA